MRKLKIPKSPSNGTSWHAWFRSPRALVFAVLALVTLGVAVLSVSVSYRILEPRFGGWAVPTVGAVDALWVVFQATEALAGNNHRRAARVRYAGLALTIFIAGLPTADLILHGRDGFDLAVILTPIAIVMTKLAWWITLPSLGRKVSPTTATTLATKQQEVADRLEQMEAEASHRIELLDAATSLEQRVAHAETLYRLSVLSTQQKMHELLVTQAQATEKTMTEMALPTAVTAIALPELETWSPVTPTLATVTPALTAVTPAPPHVTPETDDVTQVSGVPRPSGGTPVTPVTPEPVTPPVTKDRDEDGHEDGGGGTPSRPDRSVTLDELAAVAGVPVPQPGQALTDEQLDVALRHLRYSDDPPASYRTAAKAFRASGFIASEDRIRPAWRVLTAREPRRPSQAPATPAGRGGDEDDSEDTDKDSGA
jgi:hypothetical protein